MNDPTFNQTAPAAMPLSDRIPFLSSFFERNLFERIIIYIFLSAFLVKMIFEFGLGQWSFAQSQNKQWIFYALLALDYLLSVRKLTQIRVTINPMSIFAFVFFIMCAHGLLVGIYLRNAPFVILNDLVPLLMIGLNILRMQSVSEYKPVDFGFLFKICTLICIGTFFFGAIAELQGKRTGPSLAGGGLYIPMALAALCLLRPLPKWTIIVGALMIAYSIPGINRTTLAFLLAVMGAGTLYLILKEPLKGMLVMVVVLISLSVTALTLPEDSMLYQRVVGLMEVDLSERTGSIGERQAEWDAIRARLDSQGTTVEWLGLGFGGLYEFRSTHQYVSNYGHAHFAWAWFNLRFGKSGYFYLTLLVLALGCNAFLRLRYRQPSDLYVSFLCILGLIYCMTYVNNLFLWNGVEFFSRPNKDKSDLGPNNPQA
jgi:hypothetical protein